MKYNARGEEIPDTTPIEIPLKFSRPPSLQESIKAMVRRELSDAAAAHGDESFEEADDFDMDDSEGLPPSNYEFREMALEPVVPPDASVLDKPLKKEDDVGTVNSDRNKEVSDVQQSGNRGDSKGAVGAAKVG